MSALGAILNRNPKLRELTGEPSKITMGELVHRLMEPGTERLLAATVPPSAPRKFEKSKTAAYAIRRKANEAIASIDEVGEADRERRSHESRGARLGLRPRDVISTRAHTNEELKTKLADCRKLLRSIRDDADTVRLEIG